MADRVRRWMLCAGAAFVAETALTVMGCGSSSSSGGGIVPTGGITPTTPQTMTVAQALEVHYGAISYDYDHVASHGSKRVIQIRDRSGSVVVNDNNDPATRDQGIMIYVNGAEISSVDTTQVQTIQKIELWETRDTPNGIIVIASDNFQVA